MCFALVHPPSNLESVMKRISSLSLDPSLGSVYRSKAKTKAPMLVDKPFHGALQRYSVYKLLARERRPASRGSLPHNGWKAQAWERKKVAWHDPRLLERKRSSGVFCAQSRSIPPRVRQSGWAELPLIGWSGRDVDFI